MYWRYYIILDFTFSVIEDENQRNELAEFYINHKNKLYSIAFSRLHNKEDAEDAVQEAFSRISDKPDRFFNIQLEKRRIAYVNVMVRNIAIDIFNSKNKYIMTDIDEEEITDSSDISLDDRLLEDISRDELVEFVDKLPPLQRNVLILTCFVKISIDETASKLNISKKAANWRLYLARKSIKEFVSKRINNL